MLTGYLMFATCSSASISPTKLRALVYRHHPCLARIIDREDGRWDPTVDYGGGHGNTSESYGLAQANPGTKMQRFSYTAAGHRAGERNRGDWLHNPWVQIRWAINYAIGKFGSECRAWYYWRLHSAW